ncbi:acyl-CoA N-acyltransferase [Stipitochalara longipes BDJ]|nr:acyl-CoA N-acyltransferase [Stipitochalara longipes BDJ]
MASTPNTTPILALSRNIAIRPFLASDASSLAHHGNDKEMWLNGPDIVPFPFTLTDGVAYIARANDTTNWAHPSSGPAIPTIDNECIGSIEFMPGTDIHSRTFKLGYWIGREHWGKGIMTEAVTAFVAWIWERFEKIVRIEAEVHDFNLGSGRVLERSGFVREGVLRCSVWKEGRLAGLEIWGVVREGVEV